MCGSGSILPPGIWCPPLCPIWGWKRFCWGWETEEAGVGLVGLIGSPPGGAFRDLLPGRAGLPPVGAMRGAVVVLLTVDAADEATLLAEVDVLEFEEAEEALAVEGLL